MICCLVRDDTGSAEPGVLEAIARTCSPRVSVTRETAVAFDADGLARMLGSPADIAREIVRQASARQVAVRVALAGSATAAWLLAHARAGVSIVEPGREAAALAGLPISVLTTLPEAVPPAARRPVRRHRRSSRHYRLAPGPGGAPVDDADAAIATCRRWGVATLGDLARLPAADVRTRLGPFGARLSQAARGEDAAPLVPSDVAPGFGSHRELDWPISGLEPLAFVLGRLCDEVSVALERADRGAVLIRTRLRLVTRECWTRALRLPAPMRDARVLRTLILLDLESHPPPAAIDAVGVDLDVTPGRIVQGSLLARALPGPEALSTLLARLGALVGDSRVGAPALVDTHDGRAVARASFDVRPPDPGSSPPARAIRPGTTSAGRYGLLGLRRFRPPIAAGVTVDRGAPADVRPAARRLARGPVVAAAGPWRTSGWWWAADGSAWDRDEWDVELAAGGCYRLARDRTTGRWTLEGELD